MQCVHPKLKVNSHQFKNISSLPYLPDIIDLDNLSTKSDISNYIDVQDVMLTMIDNVKLHALACTFLNKN